MSKVVPTNKFKKQRKKVKKDARWNRIFNGKVPFENDDRSPWEYVIDCFINEEPIDEYFYEHPITLTTREKSEIKRRLYLDANVVYQGIKEINALDLHFDGHNGDHLLLYVRTSYHIIYLIGIGTHSELF